MGQDPTLVNVQCSLYHRLYGMVGYNAAMDDTITTYLSSSYSFIENTS